MAIVFLNVGSDPVDVVCNAECIDKTGLLGKAVHVRDLWKHVNMDPVSALNSLTAKALAPEGGHLMLLLTPQ